MTDRTILYSAAFVRALATGMIGVLMGVFLAHLDFNPARIGYVVGAGLFGCAAAALLVTLLGDGAGRRRSPGTTSCRTSVTPSAAFWPACRRSCDVWTSARSSRSGPRSASMPCSC